MSSFSFYCGIRTLWESIISNLPLVSPQTTGAFYNRIILLLWEQNLWHQKLYGKSLSSLQQRNSAGTTLVEDPEVLKVQERQLQEQQQLQRQVKVEREVNGVATPSPVASGTQPQSGAIRSSPGSNNSNSRPLPHIKVTRSLVSSFTPLFHLVISTISSLFLCNLQQLVVFQTSRGQFRMVHSLERLLTDVYMVTQSKCLLFRFPLL